jgi:hypothetical protein
MLAFEFKNMNETLKMMYELDGLVNSVLANSSCKDLDAIAIFKLLKNQSISTPPKELELSSAALHNSLLSTTKS